MLVALIANANKSEPKAAVGTPSPIASAPATTPSAAPAPSLSGYWHDDDGLNHASEQDRANFTYRQIRRGEVVGTGGDRVAGRTLTYSFSTTNGGGSCEGTVSNDAALVSGACREGASQWPFSIRRGSS